MIYMVYIFYLYYIIKTLIYQYFYTQNTYPYTGNYRRVSFHRHST